MLVPAGILALACLAFGFGGRLPLHFFIEPSLSDALSQGVENLGGFHFNALFALAVGIIAAAAAAYWFGLKKTGKAASATDYIEKAPGFRSVYALAEKRVFDPYEQGLRALFAGGRGLFVVDRVMDFLTDTLPAAITGFAAGAVSRAHTGMYSWRDREMVLDCLESISGNRVHYSMNTIGGVRRDISVEQKNEILKKIDILEERTKYYIHLATEEPTVLARASKVGMSGFFLNSGFRHFYGVSELAKGPTENPIGFFDHELFDKATVLFNGMQKPFFAAIMTLTNHGPYTLPSSYKPDPSLSKVLNAFKYSDWALGRFMPTPRRIAPDWRAYLARFSFHLKSFAPSEMHFSMPQEVITCSTPSRPSPMRAEFPPARIRV